MLQIVETMAFTDNVADFLTSVDSFTNNVPVEDLELCIGPALEKVRSLPGSPLANTPLGNINYFLFYFCELFYFKLIAHL